MPKRRSFLKHRKTKLSKKKYSKKKSRSRRRNYKKKTNPKHRSRRRSVRRGLKGGMAPSTPDAHRIPPYAESNISRSYGIMRGIIDGDLDEELKAYVNDTDLKNLKGFYTSILQNYVAMGNNRPLEGGTIFHEILKNLHAAEQGEPDLNVVGIYNRLDDYKRFLIRFMSISVNGEAAGNLIPLDMPWNTVRDDLSTRYNDTPSPSSYRSRSPSRSQRPSQRPRHGSRTTSSS
jgi:hypothetical protein